MAQTYTVKKGDTLSNIAKNLGVDYRKITGYKSGDPNKIQIGEVLNIPDNISEKPASVIDSTGSTTGVSSSPLTSEIEKRALGQTGETTGEKTPEQSVTERLATNLTKYATAPSVDYTGEKKKLEEEKGVAKQEAIVGSFEDEVMKTQNLLDSLEENITRRTQDYLVSEAQRSRLYASEQAPLLKSLSTAERGLTGAEKRLTATKSDILTELGLIEKEKTAPMDLLEREVNIRSKIKDLATTNIPNIATTQFNDDGDLTIVTQDPITGKIDTQTVKGIGKKASQYESYQTATNANGDLTIIGIGRDGTPKQLGTFSGVAKSTDTNATSPEKAKANANTVLDQISMIESAPGKVYGIGAYSSLMPGTPQYDYQAQVNRLKNLLTIENLGIMKGVLSETDVKILASAASALDTKMSESAFKQELERIKSKMKGIAGTSQSPTGGQEYEANGVRYVQGSDGLFYPK